MFCVGLASVASRDFLRNPFENTVFSTDFTKNSRCARLPGLRAPEPSPGKARAARVNALSLKEKEALAAGDQRRARRPCMFAIVFS